MPLCIYPTGWTEMCALIRQIKKTGSSSTSTRENRKLLAAKAPAPKDTGDVVVEQDLKKNDKNKVRTLVIIMLVTAIPILRIM